MRPYLLIDFGSTYTKLTAVDLAKPAVLGTASALTTVAEGLIVGYRQALKRLTEESRPAGLTSDDWLAVALRAA